MASINKKTKTEKAKPSDEEFLLTLLDNVKVDHETASKAFGISKAACRMRFIRLQQRYGFKTKGNGTPRRQQAPTSNSEETITKKEETPIKESDAAENEATEDEATEN
ncbi:hypothetical protein VN97_g2112 [Penicillium thymicola]|uniref:Myb-like DNA-binding domain-containing protein n=1 Tax=Penicillium thymicola TaxID=293382 RepID=A0AAI9TPR1_PENTH|nr:hypothetical protein VN97_g2112 [Penicillium thymicola]